MAVEMSTTSCGRLETLSPPKESTLTTLSIVKRSTDCAAAGLAGRAQTASTRAGRTRPSRMRSNDHIAGLGHDAGERAGERANDLGVELGAGAAPQLLQRRGRRSRAAVRARRRHGIVGVGDVDDACSQRNV